MIIIEEESQNMRLYCILQKLAKSGSLSSKPLHSRRSQPAGARLYHRSSVVPLKVSLAETLTPSLKSSHRFSSLSLVVGNLAKVLSPRKMVVSASKNNEIPKLCKRRKIKRWTTLEEDTLWTGVQKHDMGDDTRFIEFYNLVFMQYNITDDGLLEPLKQQNIDIGLGLERMARILQKDDKEIWKFLAKSLSDVYSFTPTKAMCTADANRLPWLQLVIVLIAIAATATSIAGASAIDITVIVSTGEAQDGALAGEGDCQI
ncbi:hypothetical protein LguiB_021333 [Lonicera macranthoides]